MCRPTNEKARAGLYETEPHLKLSHLCEKLFPLPPTCYEVMRVSDFTPPIWFLLFSMLYLHILCGRMCS
jgi:hypothetical protein